MERLNLQKSNKSLTADQIKMASQMLLEGISISNIARRMRCLPEVVFIISKRQNSNIIKEEVK